MRFCKILLLGAGGVGKSTYLEYLKTSTFTKQYIETYKTKITTIIHNNDYIEIIDTAGQEIMSNYEELDCDAIIVMFDVGSMVSYKRAKILYEKLLRKRKPIVLVGNKTDQSFHKVIQNNHSLLKTAPYYQISVKNNQNLFSPIDYILNC